MLSLKAHKLKAHKVKARRVKRKVFSLNKRETTLCSMVECHYKKENIQRKLQKKILSTKPWPLEEEVLLSGSARRQKRPWPWDQPL